MAECLLRGKRFFCREWAFSKINHCLESRTSAKTCGALIMGGPGCGKSALICELVWPTHPHGKQAALNKRLLASHFCQAHNIDTLSMVNFILNIVRQLSESSLIPSYADRLRDPAVQKMLDVSQHHSGLQDPDEMFKKCILSPLSSIPPPEHNLFIVVDSVDESFYHCVTDITPGSKTIAELLTTHQQLIPPWLLLVCSSRKQSKTVTRFFTGFRKISLDDLRKSPVVRDVQQYILSRLDQESSLRQHLSRETAEMLNQLHIKSNGCILYLEKVLDGVAETFILLREIREIPGTLNGLYLWLCQRLFNRKQFVIVMPILNVILSAQRPLTISNLYDCVKTKNTALTRTEFDDSLQLLSKILIDANDECRILFHHSFAEWLLDVKHCTQKYLCNAAEGHAMCAMCASLHADQLSSLQVQDFALHLVRSNFPSPVQYNHLIHWFLLSGANIEESLCREMPKDQRAIKLLLDAGATIPSEETNAVSMVDSIKKMSESDMEDPIKNLDESATDIEEVDTNGRTLLLNAAYNGELDMVLALMARNANLKTIDKTGQTALNLSARQGHAAVVSVLLTGDVNVNHTDNEGWTALRSAAWAGHTDVVAAMLDAQAEVDHADSDGRTALRAAAWGGHDDIVLKLLAHGGNVNAVDNEGRTSLIAAAYMGHTDIVDHLLDHGADINHEDRDGRTALSVAALCIPASKGHESVVSLLLERGAEVDHCDQEGMTPLLVAACEGHQHVCELLLEWDADVDHADHSNRTSLLAAASMGHSSVVSQLLFWGAQVDTIDAEGRTVLSIAAAQGNVEVVQSFLDRGLDEMHRDNAGWTPLHMACYEGHKQVATLLLNSGAKVNEIDNDGRHALILAAQEGHAGVVAVLLQYSASVHRRAHDGKTAMRVACLEEHIDVAQLLLNQGADINYRDADGRSTLYVLSLENKLRMANYVLEMSADTECFDLEGRTALHVAAWLGHYEVCDVLIKNHANVNAMDNDQRTPLQSAAWQGHEQVVSLLLCNGALIDHSCNQGATALCIAAQEGHNIVVKILLQHKANPNHADQYGRTPLRVAAKSGHIAVVKLLEDSGAGPSSGSGSSHKSNSSNDTKPSSTGPEFSTVGNAAGLAKDPDSLHSSPKHGLHGSPSHCLHSSPSQSPASTFDRRKSYHSNNSQSSSNITSTSSTPCLMNTSATSLTFTQQLQQASMSRNHARATSRVLTPVSEPQSPVTSLPSPSSGRDCTNELSAIVTSAHITEKTTQHQHNINALGPPSKSLGSKKDKIAATINIYTNPNVEMIPTSPEEPVWKLHPQFLSNAKNNLSKVDPKKNVVDDTQSDMMYRTSPDLQRNRNGVRTNPNLRKQQSPVSNGYCDQLSRDKIMNDDDVRKTVPNTSATKIPHYSPVLSNATCSKPATRPNGLPLTSSDMTSLHT